MAKFHNLDKFEPRGPLDILKWKVTDTLTGRRRKDRNDPFVTPRIDNDGRALAALEASLTWIGHATFVLRLGGLVVVTDPIWSTRLGPGLKRNIDPGVALESLPPIDVVTISHAHYDHLDLPSLRRLSRHTEKLAGRTPTFVVPSEVGRYLRGEGLGEIVERAWWEEHVVERDGNRVQLTLVPQQHWSMRTPFDRDQALWGGWVIRGREGAAYHAGDTAYFEHFGDISARAGAIDWAMIPIGAYDPPWFMKPQHINPEEAGRAFVDLGARNLVPMHWGTFKLTDEPLGEPVERVRAWWDEHGPGAAAHDRLWVLAVGETRRLAQIT